MSVRQEQIILHSFEQAMEEQSMDCSSWDYEFAQNEIEELIASIGGFDDFMLLSKAFYYLSSIWFPEVENIVADKMFVNFKWWYENLCDQVLEEERMREEEWLETY